MTFKPAWETEIIRVLYDRDATYRDMAAAASIGAVCKVTPSAVQNYAKRNWPVRQFDVAAKQLREMQQENNRRKRQTKRAGKSTLPTLQSLQA